MEIRKLNNDDLARYDELINNSIEGTIFHKSWWLSIFKDYYGNSYNADFYGAFENSKLISGMPIPMHSKFGIKFIYHPKLTPYLGPFYLNRNANKYGQITRNKKINDEFGKILSRLKNCIHYSFHYNNIDLQPFRWNGFDIGVEYTYILNLCDLEDVWENIDKTRRHDINKCYKQNYDVRLGEIEKFIELNKKTMKRQNHSLLGEKLWLKIYNECKKNNCCEVFTAYKGQLAMASLYLVWDNKRSYYLAGGINNNSEGAMSLVMWEAIKYTKEKLNLNEFDFEGSGIRSIEFYFRKFGGDIKPIFYISENSIKKIMIMKLYSFL